LIVIGVGIAAVLTSLLGPGAPPSHPIQDEIASAGAGQLLSLLVIAAVIVPPIEEIVFRGVLYRHLREAFGRVGSLLGFAAAALASSLLFAALHPQGLGFVPILASLAVAFCIARELTGSVVPAIVAHGVSNAAIVALNAALFSV
jgi:membrane protease YdiL (CAAX protease family)